MKRGLQIVLAILSFIPIMVSFLGLTQGAGRWVPTDVITPNFDSHYRYITGYYLSLGMLGVWMIPKIERHTTLFRIVGISIFLGGIGRLISIIQVGVPPTLTLFFTALELSFPLLIFWQSRLARV